MAEERKEKEFQGDGAGKSSAGADMETLAALLKEIRDEDDKQRKYMKKQLHFLQLCALIMAALVVAAGIGIASFLPKFNALVEETDTALQNINTVTKELAEADVTGMLDNVDALVVSSQESMGKASEKIMAIDIESLNGAIADLQAVVEPLAELFGKKR